MPKITEFQTPTGPKGDLLKPKTWWPLILGTAVLMLLVSLGTKLFNVAMGVIPGQARGWFGGGPFIRPNANSAPQQTGPQYNIYS